MPLRLTEDIAVFYKNQPTYNPQFIKGKPYKSKWSSGNQSNNPTKDWRERGYVEQGENRYPTNVLLCKKESGIHPTQKPIPLLEYLIKTYTNENDIVLDSTMGSGSTGVACVNTNRKFIGIEKDEKYYDISNERITYAILDKEGVRHL